MELKHSLLLAAVIALAPAISVAQEGTAKPTAQEKPVAVPATAAPVEVTVPIVGLTNENSAKAKESLEGLTTKAYVCAPCHETQAKAGNCSHCKAPLASKELKPLGSVSVAADKGTAAFKVQNNARVSLAQIETALQKNSLKVDREKLQFRGPVVIAVGGAKDAAAVEQALKDSKLFASVEATMDADTNQVHVWVQPGSSAATLATITAALEKQPQGWKVSDVIWGAGSEKAS
jgi:cytochrome c553